MNPGCPCCDAPRLIFDKRDPRASLLPRYTCDCRFRALCTKCKPKCIAHCPCTIAQAAEAADMVKKKIAYAKQINKANKAAVLPMDIPERRPQKGDKR